MAMILDEIKTMLGESSDDFNTDITIFANNALYNLYELGVTDTVPTVNDTSAIPMDVLPKVTVYVYMKVRLLFDPPSNASVLEAIKAAILEEEYRMKDGAAYKKRKEEG